MKEILNKEKEDINKEYILESFIISDTEYNDLIKGMVNPPSKKDFEDNNVLFFEDKDWCEKLFEKLKI